jgi:hypothetical protein
LGWQVRLREPLREKLLDLGLALARGGRHQLVRRFRG